MALSFDEAHRNMNAFMEELDFVGSKEFTDGTDIDKTVNERLNSKPKVGRKPVKKPVQSSNPARTAPNPSKPKFKVKIDSRTLTQEELDLHTICPVCQNDFDRSEKASVLVCGHIFHPNCVKRWLETQGKCPICGK